MINKKRKVVWAASASRNFIRAIEYISQDSPANAKNVELNIRNAVRELSVNASRYPADKYRLDKDPDYRAFELHHYRISYRIKNSEIHIIRFRHTSQLPLEY